MEMRFNVFRRRHRRVNLLPHQVCESGSRFEPCLYKCHLFTKTGSGQRWRKLNKYYRFLRCDSPHVNCWAKPVCDRRGSSAYLQLPLALPSCIPCVSTSCWTSSLTSRFCAAAASRYMALWGAALHGQDVCMNSTHHINHGQFFEFSLCLSREPVLVKRAFYIQMAQTDCFPSHHDHRLRHGPRRRTILDHREPPHSPPLPAPICHVT